MSKMLGVSLEEKQRVAAIFRNALYKKAREIANSIEKPQAWISAKEKIARDEALSDDELEAIDAVDKASKAKITVELPHFLEQQTDILDLLDFFELDSLEDLSILQEILQEETQFKQLIAGLGQPVYSSQRIVCEQLQSIRNILLPKMELPSYEEWLNDYIEQIRASDLSVSDQRERLKLAYDCLATLKDGKISWQHHNLHCVSIPSSNGADEVFAQTGKTPLRERVTTVHKTLSDNKNLLTEKVSPSVKTIIFNLIQALSNLLHRGEPQAPKTDFFGSRKVGEKLHDVAARYLPSVKH